MSRRPSRPRRWHRPPAVPWQSSPLLAELDRLTARYGSALLCESCLTPMVVSFAGQRTHPTCPEEPR